MANYLDIGEDNSAVLSSRAHELLKPDYAQPSNYGMNQIMNYISGDGFNCSIAENFLQNHMIIDKLNTLSSTGGGLFTTEDMGYTIPTGSIPFKTAFIHFLQRHVFKNCIISHQELICASGCVALLHQLAIVLFEPGDGVMIPLPFYPAFIHDFYYIGQVTVFGIDLPKTNKNNGKNENGGFNKEIYTCLLQDTYDRALSENHMIKAILICNPDNPTGYIYSREELLCIYDFCQANNVHLIMDEIYALSVYNDGDGDNINNDDDGDNNNDDGDGDNNNNNDGDGDNNNNDGDGDNINDGFMSMATILALEHSDESNAHQNGGSSLGTDLVHFVYSLSKDLGGSGLRVGCLYSNNYTLLECCSRLSDAMMISRLTQVLLTSLLHDYQFMDDFIHRNQVLLRQSMNLLRNGLINKCGFAETDIYCGAGIFIWVNFESWFQYITKTETSEQIRREMIIRHASSDAQDDDDNDNNIHHGLTAPTLIDYSLERALYILFTTRKIYFTDGYSCMCKTPGFFRICFARIRNINEVDGLVDALVELKNTLMCSVEKK